jgi:predicted AlkP superfamily phosphohydrolase/phosphomutase
MANRLVVIALSEASPELLDEFCADGTMPRLQTLRDKALLGRTRYGVPCLLTPQMWATILTGRDAGSHGIFDYWQRTQNGTFSEMRGAAIQGRCLWDELARQDIPCGFVNVPMTWPAPRTKGFAISGQDAPGEHASMVFPDNLHAEMTRRFGRYHHKEIFPGRHNKPEYGHVIPREVALQAEVFHWLTGRSDWRFLMLYSSGTAFAQHYFWQDMAEGTGPTARVIQQTFAASDRLIGLVADLLDGDDTLVVMSECGAGPIAGGVRLNTWLRQHGYLATSRSRTGPLAKALTVARTYGPRYLPKRSLHFVNQLRFKNWLQAKVATDGIDWSRTVAFHRGKGEGNIYVNLQGRDPQGIVPQTGYEPLRTSIIADLMTLQDPASGACVVRAVHRREDLFSHTQLGAAPDLIVEWDDFRYMPSEQLDATDDIFGPRIREYMNWATSGSHRAEGFLLMCGNQVGAGRLDTPIALIDLAPTWIEVLGGSVPSTMQGRSVLDKIRAWQAMATS